MQYQQKKERKKKRGEKEKGMFSAAKWEKDNDLLLVSKLDIFCPETKEENKNKKQQTKLNRRAKKHSGIQIKLKF